MTNAPIFRAADFLNSLGVDTHIPYTDGGYSNISNVTADLAYIGLTHVRDGIGNGLGGVGQLASMIKLAQQGVTFTLCIVDGSTTSTAGLTAKLALVQRLIAAVPGCVTAIEGANEINNWPVTFNGVGGLQGAIDLQKAIYTAVHANPAFNGIAVDYFTGYSAGNVAVGPNPATTPGLADYDTQHPYPNFGQAPGIWIDPATAVANEAGARGPLVYTETGYSSNGGTWGAVDQTVQAKYTLDLLFDSMKDGVAQVDLYELMDAYANGSPQGNAGYGLFDTSNKPKLVATALHNMTAILSDTGAGAATFQTKATAPTITGLPATGQSLVLEKSNGVFDVVVWAEPKIWNMTTGSEVAAPTQAVTIDLGAAYGSVSVFDPLTGVTAVNTLTNVRFVQVGVTDHPVIIEVGPALAPPPVAITAQTLSASPGASTTSVAMSNGPVIVQGSYTGAAGTTVMMFDGTTALGLATLGTGGTWSYTTTTLAAGTHALTAVVTDLAGNSASCSAAPPITVSGSAPVVAITAQVLAQDTGKSATDNITSNGAVTVSGTVTGAQGTTVTVFDGTTALGTAALSPTGTWSYATILTSGSHALTAVATDPAGNSATSACAPAMTVSNSAPLVAITAEVLAQDTGASATDNITSNGAVTLSGTVAGTAGTTVTVFDGTNALGTATLGLAGTWSYATTLAAGTHALTAVATDLAGNSATSAGAAPITVTSSTPVVAITAQVLAQDTGASATDNVTSNGAVTVSGTVAGAQGTTVTVFDGTTALGTAALSPTGTWTYATTLASGTHALTAVATDPAGNRATSAGAPMLTVSSNAPVVAVTAEVLAQDTGASATDFITKNGAVTVSGTVAGAQGTTVTVFDGTTALGAATLSPTGTWTYATTLAAGTHALTATATDLAGNRSTAAVVTPITVITGAPVIKIGAATLAADGTTETLTGTLSGPAGTIVTLANGATGLGAATLDGKGGWSYTGRFAPGQYALTATATDTAGNAATATPSFTIPVPAAAPKPTAAPALDTLVLNVSEDAYKGDAQFMVSVDGMWVGGVQTATASHGLGQSQAMTLSGKFGAGAHTVGVYYLNDLNGGSPATDRNLYVDSMALNGASTTTASLQGLGGLAKYLIGTPATTTDTLSLDVSEDAYLGDAQFTVSVDGQQVGGVQTVTASHAAGQSQRVTLAGNFGTGSHTIGVNFVNDLRGSSAAQDRNLYVNALTYDATTTTLNAMQGLGGIVTYAAAAPVTAPDLLSLQMSEDAYKGDAQFTVTVDGKQVGGVQTVSALHGSGQTQTFNLSGSFGTGTHVLGVKFLNDLWGGSAAADRNIYVKSATLDGTTTTLNAGQNSSGLANYTIQTPTVATAPATALALSVDAGSTLILDKDASAGAAVTFGGPTGTAQFTDATSFHGTIAGFQAMDTLDLRSVGFGAATAVDFAAGSGSGLLTVADGSHTAHLALTGAYGPASFRAAADGQGGTLITLKV